MYLDAGSLEDCYRPQVTKLSGIYGLCFSFLSYFAPNVLAVNKPHLV